MKVYRYPHPQQWNEILSRPTRDSSEVFRAASRILDDVKEEGDAALLRYEEKFDKVRLKGLRVAPSSLNSAKNELSDNLRQAINLAYNNIRTFHEAQRFRPIKVSVRPGLTCEQRAVPIESVGLYIPGGTAPLFSTVLMLAIPAKLAGCRRVVMCTPPASDGNVHPAILYAAHVSGIREIYKVGGAQAIAALTFGTKTIPRVNKIFGPGNPYVTAAKQLATLRGVAIDMPAGPSELAVLADESARTDFVAADLLSQAEHGATSQVIFVTTSKRLFDSLPGELNSQLATLPRKEIATRSLENSVMILVDNLKDGIRIVNTYAPEHLILSITNYRAAAKHIISAGSIFLGNLSCESAGDYASGTNHTLPTSGYAHAYSGLSLDSFMRKTTLQLLQPRGIKEIAPAVVEMARAEGLEGHARAMQLRMKTIHSTPRSLHK